MPKRILTDVKVEKSKLTVQGIKTKATGSNTLNAFEVTDSAGAGLLEVRENGDTVIAGVLTVNGTGTSTFAGDVSIGGSINVTEGATANLDITGQDLTLTGDLTVDGNTVLGNNATVDTTTIKGVTTVQSGVTKGAGSDTTDVFKVVDSVGAGLLQVKENGDTVIGGKLTVNGTGASTFAGDVNIGGALTVTDGATVNADLSGNDMTLTGDLTVNGNTNLGNGAEDTTTVVGTVSLPQTTTIGAATGANIEDAVTKKHTKNADAGTSSSTFYIGSGNKLKNSGGEIQVRNNADNDYANLRVKDLYVEGSQTTINSNTVNIGDNELLLNSDVTANAQNSDGGVAVKRLKVDNVTRADAKIEFNNSTNRWQAVFGDVASTITAPLTNKLSADVGDGATTTFVLTHNFGTRDLMVSIREKSSPYSQVMADIEFTDTNNIQIDFSVPPTLNEFRVTIIG